MCCYLTALFQTEEVESYFWSSLNQKLWLFTIAAPQDIKTVFGNICDKKKKKQTIKMNWDHLVIGQRGPPAVLCVVVVVVFKAIASAFLTFCCKRLYTKSPIAKQITAECQALVWKTPSSPQYSLLLMLWKEIRDPQRMQVVRVTMQVLYRGPWAGLTICRRPHEADIRQLNKV